MGKINEITQKVEQSFASNKYTTEIKDDVVEFDSNGLAFVFLDPVNVPSLFINGEEIVQNEPQVKSDWSETDNTAVSYIANKPAIRAGVGYWSNIIGDENCTANGSLSFVSGEGCAASGANSHAEGKNTTAGGYYSYTMGEGTFAKNRSQFCFGEYNIVDPSVKQKYDRGTYAEIVGNGSDDSNRSNARTLDWQGNETVAGTITANGVNLSEAISTVKFQISGTNIQASTDGGVTWHTLTFVD